MASDDIDWLDTQVDLTEALNMSVLTTPAGLEGGPETEGDSTGITLDPEPVMTAPAVTARPRGTDVRTLVAGDATAAAPPRGLWSRLTKRGPSPQEIARRADQRTITQPLPAPGVVAVANVKGAAGKTPTVVTLASALGVYRGGGVAAMDVWLRGTLARATVDHGSTLSILDLIPQIPSLMAGGARAADVARFLRYQPSGKFDVLPGPVDVVDVDEHGHGRLLPPGLAPGDVWDVIEVLQRQHQVVVVDTGNNDTDLAWQAVRDRTHQLVVPTKLWRDQVNGAIAVLETLADTGYADLAANAIVVITHAHRDLDRVDPKEARRYREFFLERGHQVIDLPPDPVIAAHQVIEWDALQPATRRAALTLGAAVIEGLVSAMSTRKGLR